MKINKISIIILAIIGILLISSSNILATSTNYVNDFSEETSSENQDGNNLKSLSVDGYEIYPIFNKNIKQYTVVVPEEIKEISVYAIPESSDAKVVITGNTNMTKKENTINVICKSKRGINKVYQIISTRQSSNGLELNELSIDGIELSPKFESTIFQYKAAVQMKENEIKPVQITAKSNDDSASIEILGNDDKLEIGDNTITILLSKSKITTVYQVVLNITEPNSIIQTNNTDNSTIGKIKLNLKSAKENIKNFFSNEDNKISTLIAVAVTVFILIIIFGIRSFKNRKKDD